MRLTAAGQVLAEGAPEVLAALAAVQARLDATTGVPRGRVSIGTLPSAGEALLPGLLDRLAALAGDGRGIDVVVDDFDLAEADYAARTLDADVVIAHSLTGDVPEGADGLVARVVAREPIDVAVPADHPLAARDRLGPADLVGQRWVGVPRATPSTASCWPSSSSPASASSGSSGCATTTWPRRWSPRASGWPCSPASPPTPARAWCCAPWVGCAPGAASWRCRGPSGTSASPCAPSSTSWPRWARPCERPPAQTLADPLGRGACQPRRTASTRSTKHSATPGRVTATSSRPHCVASTAQVAPTTAGVA